MDRVNSGLPRWRAQNTIGAKRVMGMRYSVVNLANTSLVTTAETVVATLSGISMQRPGQTICLRGALTLTTGTNTTNVRLRVREDSLTGTIVPSDPNDAVEAAAGSIETHEIYVEHAPTGEVANKTYVLTAIQTAASANGTASQASLVAEVVP